MGGSPSWSGPPPGCSSGRNFSCDEYNCLSTEFDCFTRGSKEICEPFEQENGIEVVQMDRENRRVHASCKLFVTAVVTSLRLQNTGERSMSTRKQWLRKGTREHLLEDV